MSKTTLFALIAGACLLATLLLTPLVIRLARALGAVDAGGHRNVHTKPTPRAGGLAILVPVVGACAWTLAGGAAPWLPDLSDSGRLFQATAFASLLLAFLGVLDDRKGLRPVHKLLGQIAITLLWLVWAEEPHMSQLTVPFVGWVELAHPLAFALSVLWVVGTINALNLIDGLDGLAAGIALVAATVTSALFASNDTWGPLIVMLALSGSLLGFLRYNVHPARVFLGDTGSMLIGFLLSTMSIAGAQRRETLAVLVAPVLVLSLPYFETTISIVRRWVHGAPVFGGDARHTHHRLLRRGFSHRGTVTVLWTVSAVNGVAAALSLLLWREYQVATYLVGAGSLLVVAWLAGYLHLPTVEEFLARRRRIASLRALTHYLALGLEGTARARLSFGELLELGRRESGLAWLEVRSAESAERFGVASQDPGAVEPPVGDQVDATRVVLRDGTVLMVFFAYDADGPLEWHDRLNTTELLASLFGHTTLKALRELTRELAPERPSHARAKAANGVLSEASSM